ncbi:MAG: DNA-directed RNA polymerase subunit B [Candidatus Micrarchaeaceae archaeon]
MSTDNRCRVYLNGKELTRVADGKAFVAEIRKNRRQGLISGEVNVSYVKKLDEVHINTDKGRVRAPYIIVENGVSKLTPELRQKLANKEIDFNYLVRRGIVEYLDAEEEEDALIAASEDSITPETTHVVIDPAYMLGLTVNLNVYTDHNQMGRHAISSNFMKQSQGVYAFNFNNRYDARSYLLFYPQAPILTSAAFRTLGLEKHSSGQNFVVALSTYYGYNMKDAVVLNKAAVDRGLGRSVFFRTYSDEERRYPGGQKDKIRIPPPSTEGYLGEHAYAKLSEDGLIEKETEVHEGDVLIGKTSPPRFLEEQTTFGISEEKSMDNSTTLRMGEEGVVDNVLLTETSGATKIVKVRVRTITVPELGDKFASRHGQKGVVALIVNQEDMPFTREGIVPDLLLNPHSLPSRMTVGHMLEMLGVKAASLSGRHLDGTTFSVNGVEAMEDFGRTLEGYGFDKFGDETLYDGRTGKAFESKLFMGVVYYNRLYHMTINHLQVRSRGPVQILTRQPTEGKARGGGMRFGEMERDALVGHGASLLIKERMLEQSDKTTIWMCKDCGDIGYFNYIKNVPVCPMCGGNNLEKVEISNAFKLLLYEINSLHIRTNVKLKSE